MRAFGSWTCSRCGRRNPNAAKHCQSCGRGWLLFVAGLLAVILLMPTDASASWPWSDRPTDCAPPPGIDVNLEVDAPPIVTVSTTLTDERGCNRKLIVRHTWTEPEGCPNISADRKATIRLWAGETRESIYSFNAPTCPGFYLVEMNVAEDYSHNEIAFTTSGFEVTSSETGAPSGGPRGGDGPSARTASDGDPAGPSPEVGVGSSNPETPDAPVSEHPLVPALWRNRVCHELNGPGSNDFRICVLVNQHTLYEDWIEGLAQIGTGYFEGYCCVEKVWVKEVHLYKNGLNWEQTNFLAWDFAPYDHPNGTAYSTDWATRCDGGYTDQWYARWVGKVIWTDGSTTGLIGLNSGTFNETGC